MKKRTTWLCLGISALAVIAAICLWPKDAAPEMAVTNTEVTLSETSAIRQTFRYTRCGHTVTRRLTAPVETYGKGMEDVRALYGGWNVTEFSGAEAVMEQAFDLYCPDHLVLLPNEENMLCLFENRYGDALVLVRETSVPLSALAAADQESAAHGLAFDTAQEAEMWLESVES